MNDVEATMPMRVPDDPEPARPGRPRPEPPLPRRRSQAHLEPQLREPGGAGTGTPFVAFADAGADIPAGAGDGTPGRHRADTAPPAEEPADGADGRRSAAGARAAVFRAATRGGPRGAARRSG